MIKIFCQSADRAEGGGGGGIPCAFWTSCRPRRLSDGGAASPCASSLGGGESRPPLPPPSAGRSGSFNRQLRKSLRQDEDTDGESDHGRRILLFGLHVILEGQLGSVLHVLLVGFEVVFGVLPPWRETNEEMMRR